MKRCRKMRETYEKKLYFCVGCRKVHYDEDFCSEDGDLEIYDIERLLESIDKVKGAYLSSTTKEGENE